jgi:hypothetical protein
MNFSCFGIRLINLEKVQEAIAFNERNLVESSRVLLEAMRDKTNVFSKEIVECYDLLPKGVEKGSEKQADFLFWMSIPDKFIDADVLFRKGRNLFEEMPEAFDFRYVYEMDKGKLKISKRRDGSRLLVAPWLDNILKEKLNVGLHESVSGDMHCTSRKLVRVYNGRPLNVFKDVTEYHVALERLKRKKTQDLEKERKELTFPNFKGFGEAKVAPLLIIWFVKNGFIQGMDKYEIRQPFDTHLLNFTVGRGVTKPDTDMRVGTFAKYAQELFAITFRKHEIDPIDFHVAEWRLGSDVCTFSDCYNLRAENGERLCPYSTPCREFLDVQKYRQGHHVSSVNNFTYQ